MISIFSQKYLFLHQSRWMLFLDQFSMKIEYILDEINVIMDLLSRISEYSGYVNKSLREFVNVDVFDQHFESESLSLIAASIIIKRRKILLKILIIYRRIS